MSWSADSIKAWVTRVSSAFETWLPGVDARLARNNVGPSATAIGGALWQLDKRLELIARDRFVHLAGEEALVRHGADFGISRKAATAAAGSVTVASTGASAITAGALVRRADGTRFRVTAAASIAGTGTYAIAVTAVTAGADGDTASGTTLIGLSGITGTVTLTVGDDGLTGGGEIEDLEDYRARILQRLAYPPQGGVTSDYWRWATSVDGCSYCWVWPRHGGVGRVTLYPVFDGVRAGGLPISDELDAVAEAVGAEAPDGALITVAAFTPVEIDVTIPDLSPSSSTVEDQIRLELANVFAAKSRVSGSADAHPSFPMRATPATFWRAWIDEAISRATGEVSHGVITPATDRVLGDGERAVLGTVTFS